MTETETHFILDDGTQMAKAVMSPALQALARKGSLGLGAAAAGPVQSGVGLPSPVSPPPTFDMEADVRQKMAFEKEASAQPGFGTGEMLQAPPAPAPSGGPMGMAASAMTGAGLPQPQSSGGGYEKRIRSAVNEGVKAGQEAAKHAAAGITAQAEVLRAADAEAQRLAAEQAEKESRRQALNQAEFDKLRALQDSFAKTEIDPRRFYARMDTGQKILAGIGIFLGGFGRGQNEALGIIQRAVDADIDAQKAAAQNRGQAVANQQNLMTILRQNFGDERQAEAAARVLISERIGRQLEMTAAKFKAPEILEKAKEAAASLRANAEMDLAKFAQETEKLNATKMASQAEAMGAGNELRVVAPWGEAQALTKESAKIAREMTGNFYAMKEDLDAIRAFREKHGVSLTKWPTEALEAARARHESFKLALKSAEQLGTLDKGSIEFLDRLAGSDIGQWGNLDAKLRGLDESLTAKYQARIRAHLDPRTVGGQRGYTARPYVAPSR